MVSRNIFQKQCKETSIIVEQKIHKCRYKYHEQNKKHANGSHSRPNPASKNGFHCPRWQLSDNYQQHLQIKYLKKNWKNLELADDGTFNVCISQTRQNDKLSSFYLDRSFLPWHLPQQWDYTEVQQLPRNHRKATWQTSF